jgi:hypothetical protein
MKSDHRHELKTNELADWVAHFPEWARENRTNLIAAGAIVVVALLVYFVSFYRGNVASVRSRTRLTSLVEEVPQKINQIANAASQNQDQSYVLLQPQQDLLNFAETTSDNNMAALALIERGVALRAELHYRLNDVSRDDLTKQIGLAQASYQQALDRKPSSVGLAAAARYGLGLCEEELGNFDQAAQIYREVAQQPEYAGTAAQASAAYRLKILNDYQTQVVFRPAPPQPAQAQTPALPQAPALPVVPGAANAPTVLPPPEIATVEPPPAGESKTEAAPTGAPATAPQTQTPPASAPTAAPQAQTPPAAAAPVAPSPPEANAPKGN